MISVTKFFFDWLQNNKGGVNKFQIFGEMPFSFFGEIVYHETKVFSSQKLFDRILC